MSKRYTPTERLGVNLAENNFLGIEWIFREEPIVDMGIDAQIELCEDGVPTGRLIALQIKTGESWFKEENKHGYVYRGSLTHLSYWKSHSLPVIVVLCNVEEQKIWWELVSNQNVVVTGKGWKMTVPFTQTLQQSCNEKLTSIAIHGLEKYDKLQQLVQELGHVGQIGNKSKLGLLHRVLKIADKHAEVSAPFLDEEMLNILKFISSDVHVRVITREFNDSILAELQLYADEHPNLDVRQSKNLHSKFLVVDEALMIIGSVNLTKKGWRGANPEIYSTIQESKTIELSLHFFEEIWSKASVLGLTKEVT